MADDDFEIDLYGEEGMEGNDDGYQAIGADDMEIKEEDSKTATDTSMPSGHEQDSSVTPNAAFDNQNTAQNGHASRNQPEDTTADQTNGDRMHDDQADIKTQSGGVAQDQSSSEVPTGTPSAPQGVKRKEGHDDRPIDPGASSAITVSELNWWVTDDDIRGWTHGTDCEAELKDITFNEHKVNGKSKGQAYVEFESPQAATAVKRHVESLAASQPSSNKYTVVFSSPATNPFRTLPRNDAQRNTTNNTGGRGNYNNQSGFRGNRGGRGAGTMNNAGVNNRGGFQGGQMGNLQPGFTGPAQMGNFGGNPMGGFQNNFGNRGGMMGGMRGGAMPNRGAARGGFGGMPNNMMGGMNMANMGNMGNMNMGMMGGQFPGPMGMNGMAGFGGQGHFNPAFFQSNQQQMGAGNDWNPHGAKRPRPE